MGEMSKIEEVARAICAENCEDYEMLPGIHKSVARASIAALRVPTDGIRASLYSFGVASGDVDECWRAVIDAALKE